MEDTALCPVCGNEVDNMAVSCPFCGAGNFPRSSHDKVSLKRVVNLERGMPTVEMAITRLRIEIKTAPGQGYSILYLIHGYGSSGKGGAIRQEVQRQLQYLRQNREINDFIPGEECSSRFGHWRQTIRRFPSLKSDGKPNPGITIVIL